MKKAASSPQTDSKQTKIIESEYSQDQVIESDYPYCRIPPFFFDGNHRSRQRNRKLFSVETWDGRNVVSFESSD